MMRPPGKPSVRIALFVLLLALWPAPLAAQVVIPNFWDPEERLVRPDLSAYTRIRFLTTLDFPPFNYRDPAGQVVGYNVELARALCEKLEVLEVCQIQAVPWDELPDALAGGEGEAAIAGLAVTGETRDRFIFTRSYMLFPARFVVPATQSGDEDPAALADKRVGVAAESSHLALLRDHFPQIRRVVYSRRDWMLRDLQAQRLDAIFGDGMRLALWLAGREGSACCRFLGGPYLSAEYLGEGLAIAASRENATLIQAFDWALRELAYDGTLADLYLRHFPVSFY